MLVVQDQTAGHLICSVRHSGKGAARKHGFWEHRSSVRGRLVGTCNEAHVPRERTRRQQRCEWINQALHLVLCNHLDRTKLEIADRLAIRRDEDRCGV